jgi:hypothetical protein
LFALAFFILANKHRIEAGGFKKGSSSGGREQELKRLRSGRLVSISSLQSHFAGAPAASCHLGRSGRWTQAERKASSPLTFPAGYLKKRVSVARRNGRPAL